MRVCDEFLPTLDVSVFEGITSQTSPEDRRSLLALQGGVKARNQTYAYLEIGSFLGWSLQPYLFDTGCTKVYSIDKRCSIAPDDRDGASTIIYQDNTSANMLRLLKQVNEAGVRKIICLEGDAADIDARKIDSPPAFAFIDGEHTYSAVLADFEFCLQVVALDGLIAFHDSYIIYPALEEICARLKRQRRAFKFWKLAGSVSVVSFDLQFADRTPHIQSLIDDNLQAWKKFSAGQRIKKVLPRPAFQMLKKVLVSSSQG